MRRDQLDSLLDMHSACCLKAEVPAELASVISLMTILLTRHWKDRVDKAERELLTVLRGMDSAYPYSEVAALDPGRPGQDEREERLLLLLLLLLERSLFAPLAPADAQAAGLLTARLVDRAGASVPDAPGAPGRATGFGASRQGVELGLVAVAALSSAVLRGHWLTAAGRVREALRTYLTSPVARSREVRLGGALPSGEAVWVKEQLRPAIDAAGSFARVGVDTWAFQVWNTARAEAILQLPDQGRVLRIINNPPSGPDQRTTPFCRWVHGRTVTISRARSFIDRYREAVIGADPEKILAAWSLQLSRDPRTFAKHLRETTLPPYHTLCRTQVFPE